MPYKSAPVISAVTVLACIVFASRCNAATNCDVTVLKASSVGIEEDKIIRAEANVGMLVITPDGETNGESLQLTGRDSTWAKIQANEATLTVLREGKGQPNRDMFWMMSVNAAPALKAGEEIDRIGFYRPDNTIKKNRIHDITGNGYVFPKCASDDDTAAALKSRTDSSRDRTSLTYAKQVEIAVVSAAPASIPTEGPKGSCNQNPDDLGNPERWGTLEGRFLLKGDLPVTGEIRLIRDFADLNFSVPDESLQVDRETRGIANVMVFVRSPNVAVHPRYADAIKRPRVMEYTGPRLAPRVTSLHVNQPLDFRNANPFGHAVWIEPRSNPKSVFVIPGKKNITTNTFAQSETQPLKIRDPVHSLSPFGWIMVADHPYVAVTDTQGQFVLKDLPAGKLEFQCWHERVGWLAARPSWKNGRFSITVTAGKNHDLGGVSVSSSLFRDKISDDPN